MAIENFDQMYSKLTQYIDGKNQDSFVKLTQYIDDKNRDTVDLMRQEFRGQLADGLQRMKKEIVAEVSDAIGNGIVPQLEDHESRLLTLEKKSNV